MTDTDDVRGFPRSTDDRDPETADQNRYRQPEVKADDAIEEMEKEGDRMSERAEQLLEEGKAELRAILDRPDEEE